MNKRAILIWTAGLFVAVTALAVDPPEDVTPDADYELNAVFVSPWSSYSKSAAVARVSGAFVGQTNVVSLTNAATGGTWTGEACRVVLAGLTNVVQVDQLPTNIVVSVSGVGGDTNSPAVSLVGLGSATARGVRDAWQTEGRTNVTRETFGGGWTNRIIESEWSQYASGMGTNLAAGGGGNFSGGTGYFGGVSIVPSNWLAVPMGAGIFGAANPYITSWRYSSGVTFTNEVTQEIMAMSRGASLLFCILAAASLVWVSSFAAINHVSSVNLNVTTGQSVAGTNVSAGTQKGIHGAVALFVVGAVFALQYWLETKTPIKGVLGAEALLEEIPLQAKPYVVYMLGPEGVFDLGQGLTYIVTGVTFACVTLAAGYGARKFIEAVGV